MPINPNIPLGINPPQQQGMQPMDVYQQVMQMRQMAEHQRNSEVVRQQNEIENENLRTAQQKQQQIQQIMLQSGGDLEKALGPLAQVDPVIASKIAEQVDQQKQARAKRSVEELALGAKQNEMRANILGTFKRLPDGVKASAYPEVLNQLNAAGLVPKEMRGKLPQQWDSNMGTALDMMIGSATTEAQKDAAEHARKQEERAAAAEGRAAELQPLNVREKTAQAIKAEQEAAGTAPVKPTGDLADFRALHPNGTEREYFDFLKAKRTPVAGVDVPLDPAVEAQRKRIAGAGRAAAVAANGGTSTDAKDIARGIAEGRQPPTFTGLYGKSSAVRAELERMGYNVATAQLDWNATQKHLATLNGAQQERLRQAVTFTEDSLSSIEQLYSEWNAKGLNTRFKGINKMALAAARNLGGEGAAIAQNLEAQINDLTSELGTVYKGGNASTDETLRLAAENLRGNWDEPTFKRAIKQIRTNLQIRRNSILNSQPTGVSPNSPYSPKPQGDSAPPAGSKNDPLGIR